MGLGIQISLPSPSRDSLQERITAFEKKARTKSRLDQDTAQLASMVEAAGGRGADQVYNRQGRATAIDDDGHYAPEEQAPSAVQGPSAQTRPGLAGEPHLSADVRGRAQAVAVEARLVAASVNAAAAMAETRATVGLGATGSPLPPAEVTVHHESLPERPDLEGVGTKALDAAKVTIPDGASSSDLMRVASTLRQHLLRNREPTVRDRELATLASKIESQARAMARSESQQRIARLREDISPGDSPKIIRPNMRHIARYLDELADRSAHGMSYFTQGRVHPLSLAANEPPPSSGVEAVLVDSTPLEGVDLGLINGTILGEGGDSALARYTEIIRRSAALKQDQLS